MSEYSNMPVFDKVVVDTLFLESDLSRIYFLIDEEGRVLKETWNDTHTKYYGADGKACGICHGSFFIETCEKIKII